MVCRLDVPHPCKISPIILKATCGCKVRPPARGLRADKAGPESGFRAQFLSFTSHKAFIPPVRTGDAQGVGEA